MTALPKDADRPPDAETRIEALAADNAALAVLCYSILDRLSRAEETIARLASATGCDAPSVPPVERTSVKQAAGRLRCSTTRVYQLIGDGTLAAVKDHGRVLVEVELVEKLCRERNPQGT
jgi:excisionase family DNA binding protein